MRIAAFTFLSLSIMATGAFADPISDRKANMRERGGVLRVLAPIAQGQQPFDAAVVMDALEKLNANAQAVDVAAFYPEGSNAGDTKASPKIWEDMAGFQAANDKFAADVAAAVEANPADLGAFQAVFGPVAANCGACHGAYRL